MTGRKRRFLLLILLLLLVIYSFPALLMQILQVSLSRTISNPNVPLVAGSVEKVDYNALVLTDLKADAGNGIFLNIPSLEARYTPKTLLRSRIHSVTGQIFSTSEILFTADVAAREIRFSPDGVNAQASLSIPLLEIPENSLSLNNLTTACAVERSGGKIRSAPEQLLTVDHLSLGNLKLDDIRLHYQLEPDSAFFLEGLELNWCEGRVSLYNARFRPETTEVSVQLFCDRLSLEQVLAACGVKDVSAGGELNGRMPVRWTADGLSIDRGFLFTTPGRSGTFSFGTAKVAEGILPPGSLEQGQVGLVTAALAEFNYDWITLTLNSEGENLLVVVEMAGTPANILPYEYDSGTGTYVKTALRPGRGIRQTMRFNLNLTVPMNQLLCYASGVNRQWDLLKAKGDDYE